FPGVGSTIGIAAAAADPGDLPATPGTEIGGDFWCLAGAHLDGVDRTTLTDGTLQFGLQLPGKLLNQGQGLLFVVVARCLFGCPTRRGEGTKGNQRRGQGGGLQKLFAGGVSFTGHGHLLYQSVEALLLAAVGQGFVGGAAEDLCPRPQRVAPVSRLQATSAVSI